MVVAIGGEIEVVAPLSTDHAAALAAIDRLDAWGTTPLYDAALVGARRDPRPAAAARWCCCRTAPTDTATRRPRIWSIRRGDATC